MRAANKLREHRQERLECGGIGECLCGCWRWQVITLPSLIIPSQSINWCAHLSLSTHALGETGDGGQAEGDGRQRTLRIETPFSLSLKVLSQIVVFVQVSVHFSDST